jgi:putative sigma-54 modulation protein
MTIKVDIFARNLEVDDGMKDYVTKKASKLDRYLNDVEQVKVDLDFFKSARSATDRYVAQITVRGHRALLRTEERSDELRTAFDETIDKMQRKLERYKGKHYHGRGDGKSVVEVIALPEKNENEEPSGIISRHKTFDLEPMSEAEALEQMKLLGHENFFIFFNAETDTISVLYHRRDETYGLIEPKVR